MNKLTLQILKALVITDSVVIFLSIIFFDIKVIWNTQIGFLSASLVMLASMKSYKKMVDARVENNIITIDDTRDTIDKLEDVHDLYSEEIVAEENIDIRDAIKDEKARMKKNRRSLGETLRDTKAALSLNRIGAYVVLILGFFYLNRHGYLMTPAYILALSIPMLVVVFVLLSNKETQTQDLLQ
ncbi:hypothetical protein MNB_SV-3-1254 [hydrothermal vent metagenome]|uniref:Uncharacterized protein n=1 Tax=hydrothermal vent metagenome TaxID=652676 RepID=A0A1W1CQM0_9ZZZZ